MNLYSIIPHILDHEFVIIERGKGKVTIEGKVYSVHKEMLFYFYPNLKHSIETDSKTPMSFYAVHFIFTNVEYINNSWYMKSEKRNLELSSQTMLNNVFVIMDFFKQLNKCWKDKLPGGELYCRAILQQLFLKS